MPDYKASYLVYKDNKTTTETKTYHANNRVDAERKAKDLVSILARTLEARVEYQSVGLNVKKK